MLRSDSRSCDIVERSTLLILYSFENDLSPEQLVFIFIHLFIHLFIGARDRKVIESSP